MWVLLAFASGFAVEAFLLEPSSRWIGARWRQRVGRRRRKGARASGVVVARGRGRYRRHPRYRALRPRNVVWGLAGLGCFLSMIVVMVAQAHKRGWAFDAEETVLATRIPAVLAAFGAGLFGSAFRSELSVVCNRLSRGFAVEATASPWPVQLVLTLAAIIGTVLLVRPGLIDKISELKAGDVEAHFSESASAIQKAPVNFLEVSAKSSLSNWTEFQFYSGENGTNYRSLTYKASKAKLWKLTVANIVFTKQLKTFFSYIDCFEQRERIDIVHNNQHFIDFTYGFATLIRDSFGRHVRTPDEQIQAYAENFKEAVAAESEWRSRAEGLFCSPLPPVARIEEVQTQLDQAVDDIDDASPPVDEPIWDPTIETAVADMIGFLKDKRGRAELLDAALTAGRSRHLECEGQCDLPVYGRLNLLYETVEAKVSSSQPWPLDDLIGDLGEALAGLDRLVNSRTLHDAALREHPEGDDGDGLWNQTQRLYRRNRLVDLSLGLEIYYQRALAGETLGLRHRAQWKAWLDEARQIIAITQGVGLEQVGFMDGERTSSWKATQQEIAKDPFGLEDAVTSIALSLVLLPRQSGVPTAQDCAAARSMVDYGSNDVFHLLSIENHGLLDASSKATYKGFLAQVANRVDGECL